MCGNPAGRLSEKFTIEKGSVMDIDIIFKIAGIGIAIAVLNQVLVKAGREEQAMLTTLAGVIVVLMLVIQMISEFFDAVKTFLEF